MARYGKRVKGHIQDSLTREAAAGREALITEIIHVMPTSDIVTLYNLNGTAYGAVPTDVTTGAAILKHIKQVTWIGVTPMMVTGVMTTSTAVRVPWVKIINGPTTVAKVYAPGCPQAAGSGVMLNVVGVTW